MNDKYIKKIKNNNIIFKDKVNNTELTITHIDDKHSFDEIFIDEKYDLDFIDYFVKELKKTNDIAVIFSLYSSSDLEKILLNNNLKISNYQYIIKFKEYPNTNQYEISTKLNDESKAFYLKTINNIDKINHNYINPNSEFIEFSEKWFETDEFVYRIYSQDGTIVGIVDYEIFEDDVEYWKYTNNIFNYNNKLCIRCLFGENEIVLKDIIIDLLNTYKKDIVINTTYAENDLKNVIKQMNGIFNYGRYTLVDIDI